MKGDGNGVPSRIAEFEGDPDAALSRALGASHGDDLGIRPGEFGRRGRRAFLVADGEHVEQVRWEDLPSRLEPDHLTACYIPSPAAADGVEVQRFVDLVATLRRRCPWDAEQTHASLRPHLLEEAYEVLEAIDGFDGETGEGSSSLELSLIHI